MLNQIDFYRTSEINLFLINKVILLRNYGCTIKGQIWDKACALFQLSQLMNINSFIKAVNEITTGRMKLEHYISIWTFGLTLHFINLFKLDRFCVSLSLIVKAQSNIVCWALLTDCATRILCRLLANCMIFAQNEFWFPITLQFCFCETHTMTAAFVSFPDFLLLATCWPNYGIAAVTIRFPNFQFYTFGKHSRR